MKVAVISALLVLGVLSSGCSVTIGDNKPDVACEGVDVTKSAGSRYTLSIVATYEPGEEVMGYTYIVLNTDGQEIVRKDVPAGTAIAFAVEDSRVHVVKGYVYGPDGQISACRRTTFGGGLDDQVI